MASRVVMLEAGSAEDDAVALHPDTMTEDPGTAMRKATLIEEGMARATVAAEATTGHSEYAGPALQGPQAACLPACLLHLPACCSVCHQDFQHCSFTAQLGGRHLQCGRSYNIHLLIFP